MNKIEIGKIIQERREQLQVKQEDLAEMTGLAAKTIYLLESGKGNPSLDTLLKVLDVAGLEINIGIKNLAE